MILLQIDTSAAYGLILGEVTIYLFGYSILVNAIYIAVYIWVLLKCKVNRKIKKILLAISIITIVKCSLYFIFLIWFFDTYPKPVNSSQNLSSLSGVFFVIILSFLLSIVTRYIIRRMK